MYWIVVVVLFFFVVVVADDATVFITIVCCLWPVRLRLHALTANPCTLSGLAGHSCTFAGYGRKCAIEPPIDNDMRQCGSAREHLWLCDCFLCFAVTSRNI